MRYQVETWSSGLFEHGNCRGFAGSALVGYVNGGSGVGGLSSRSPYFGLWSAISLSASGNSGWPRLTSTTEAAIRERVEAFQLIQSSYGNVPNRSGARTAADESIRRIDAGEPPLVLGIHANNAGHALVPFKYEIAGEQIHLFVYDCNWPGDSGRYININRNTGDWDYTLWDGEYWTAGDAAITYSTYEDISAASGSMSARRAPAAEPSPPSAAVLDVDGATVLAMDSTGRRTGYAGGMFVSEIPGALPESPDPTAATRLVGRVRFGSVYPDSFTVEPFISGFWSLAYSDLDSAISVQSSGVGGSPDNVLLNPTADSVSIAPASGVRNVTIWVGTWADGGRVKYGVVDATTTAGDLTFSASQTGGRVENHSAGQKVVSLAAMGEGWVGRKASSVIVPAEGYVTFRVTDSPVVGAAWG